MKNYIRRKADQILNLRKAEVRKVTEHGIPPRSDKNARSSRTWRKAEQFLQLRRAEMVVYKVKQIRDGIRRSEFRQAIIRMLETIEYGGIWNRFQICGNKELAERGIPPKFI